MPRCSVCHETTPSQELRQSDGWVKCPRCRSNISLVEDKKMPKDLKQPAERRVLSVTVYEYTTEAGIDHRVAVEGNYGGLDVKFESTIDQIREFFTERRTGTDLKLIK